ncbi:HD-GYP domain-containing protein [Aneurinibacillus sp. Ricciae_BoGa-3]|uniref:HD-GYP domain-containing protein n=1 Tax=Aneurinibacillus sp. Ricciae_BoGa-3 TaxID=3022697 RepID=UPI002340895C|nr:HD-GYP domain-containing protein [Aneurinibacillus sp. Ricciae_BoGa-3]WCK53937.1 HD-GYP domain-containing protein [Aneurinibacillus sp. Ricciae_BoGa-3]
MRLIATTKCEPGMILAKALYTETGSVLLAKDVELTGSLLKRIKQLGIDTLYIRDKATEDIIIGDPISDETRRVVLHAIYDSFTTLVRSDKKWKARLSPTHVNSFRQAFEGILQDLKTNKNAINLLTNICTYDHYIYAHSMNVAVYSTALGIQQGLNDKELVELGMGAMLHDIGKMLIPSEILHKEDRLTEEEYEVIKRHTEYGFEMLRAQEGISLLSAHCAFQHHEKIDGTGYPRQLKGEEIHKYARLMAVGDVFDALTTHRVYRKAMLPHEAMEILYGGAGKHFESSFVEGFGKTIAIYPIGITVTLNTGETGVVVDYNRHLSSRPIVRIIKNPDGTDVEELYEIDLSKALTAFIVNCESII